MWDRRVAALRARLDTSGFRHVLAAVDAVISLLEQRNLDGERMLDRGLRERLRRLEAEVGVPLPRKAVRARNTARLHAVLLDWRETLLDSLRPERLNYPDVHDAKWNDLTSQR